MRIIIYIGHPAQYYFFKYIIKKLSDKHNLLILIKSKDILESLLLSDGLKYINVLSIDRKSSRFGIAIGLLKREIEVFRHSLSFKPNIMIGSDPSIAHIGKLLGIPALTVLEDDVDVIYDLAKITFPFSTNIITPDVCSCGRWNKKKIPYSGYMKLAYLHPKYFIDSLINKSSIVLIRLSNLKAYHDIGIRGFDDTILEKIIKKLSVKYTIKISSERHLHYPFNQYELKIDSIKIHSILSNASMLISDSQSMTMEAAMLGVPSVRISDFVGRISVLDELENKYRLTFGIKPQEKEKIFIVIDHLLAISNLKDVFQERRKKMLNDKIDVTKFMVWFIENYPKSAGIMKRNPDFQYNFR